MTSIDSKPALPWSAGKHGLLPLLQPTTPPVRVGVAVAAIFIVAESLVLYVLDMADPAEHLGAVYLLGILVVATFWPLWLAALTSILSAIAFDSLKGWHTGHFIPTEIHHVAMHAGMLLVAVVANGLARGARVRAEEADQRRREADLAAELARLLLGGTKLDYALDQAASRLARVLQLPWVRIERGMVFAGEGRIPILLGDEDEVFGTLLVPREAPPRTLRRLRERVVPALEALLRAAFDRAAATAAIEDSNAELASSRARIVAAADDARRRLERDLHDGAQQRLETLKLEVRLAEQSVSGDDLELRAQMERIMFALNDVSDDLHEFSRGIHPAVLAGGLAAALRTLARRSAVPVTLDVGVDGRLPEPVEVAAYYVVAEALTNTAKHAKAEEVKASAHVVGDTLRIVIEDDGVGGANPDRGSGLTGLTDRVEAIGGRLQVLSPSGGGTTLTVILPLRFD
ncbi:DUF4118 domain-containing protein [Mycobacterium sp. OTB74]|uniref:ATP-binding protein n=1 Tax=Mycobacterium sp. OTB74 TaxID=1853452 RepID=UPI002476B763|nr:DUF4118 domain-containing protein [Mycobacterium sp. OTB74]